MKRFGIEKVLCAMMVLAMLVIAVILFAPRVALATAASAEISTPMRDGGSIELVQGSNVVYAGTLVVADSSGLVEHATDAASKKVIGRAEVTQDNTGLNYSATKTIRVRRGIFRWVNGDSFTDANIGDLAYVEDNQTVQKAASASQDIIAGVIIDVDSSGVWVDTYDIGSQGAGSLTTLAVSGASALSGDVTASAAVALSDADGAGVMSVVGYEGSDATLVLDADQGDDNADTWIIESEAADNDLSIVNHTTEQFKVTTAGDAKSTGDLHALGGEVWLGTTGCFGIRGTTQLVFVASGVTNVVDADITN